MPVVEDLETIKGRLNADSGSGKSAASGLTSGGKNSIIEDAIKSGLVSTQIHEGRQNKHIKGMNNYIEGRSYLIISIVEAQKIIDKYHGTGDAKYSQSGIWNNRETVILDEIIGVVVDPETGEETPTNVVTIHYSKKGAHIVPAKPEE